MRIESDRLKEARILKMAIDINEVERRLAELGELDEETRKKIQLKKLKEQIHEAELEGDTATATSLKQQYKQLKQQIQAGKKKIV